MPEPIEPRPRIPKPETPPAELADRQEGYGAPGFILGYPEYRDDGVWPSSVVRGPFDPQPSETSDDREGGWQ